MEHPSRCWWSLLWTTEKWMDGTTSRMWPYLCSCYMSQTFEAMVANYNWWFWRCWCWLLQYFARSISIANKELMLWPETHCRPKQHSAQCSVQGAPVYQEMPTIYANWELQSRGELQPNFISGAAQHFRNHPSLFVNKPRSRSLDVLMVQIPAKVTVVCRLAWLSLLCKVRNADITTTDLLYPYRPTLPLQTTVDVGPRVPAGRLVIVSSRIGQRWLRQDYVPTVLKTRSCMAPTRYLKAR